MARKWLTVSLHTPRRVASWGAGRADSLSTKADNWWRQHGWDLDMVEQVRQDSQRRISLLILIQHSVQKGVSMLSRARSRPISARFPARSHLNAVLHQARKARQSSNDSAVAARARKTGTKHTSTAGSQASELVKAAPVLMPELAFESRETRYGAQHASLALRLADLGQLQWRRCLWRMPTSTLCSRR